MKIAEQLGWQAPDVVVAPMAGGLATTKIHKGLKEFEQLELLENEVKTRIYGAQAAGCNPIVDAVKRSSRQIKPVKPNTIARSLAIGNPADGYHAAGVIADSGGWAEDVTDQEIVEGIKLLAAQDWADELDTIHYEVVTGVHGHRVTAHRTSGAARVKAARLGRARGRARGGGHGRRRRRGGRATRQDRRRPAQARHPAVRDQRGPAGEPSSVVADDGVRLSCEEIEAAGRPRSPSCSCTASRSTGAPGTSSGPSSPPSATRACAWCSTTSAATAAPSAPPGRAARSTSSATTSPPCSARSPRTARSCSSGTPWAA